MTYGCWNRSSVNAATSCRWRGVSRVYEICGSRTLVVLDLQGGNDSLSMLVPYTDSFYYSRRPTIAVPAGQVLQIGSDAGAQSGSTEPGAGEQCRRCEL